MVKGNSQSLYLRTKFQTSRFEFIFSSLVKDNPRLFSSVQAVVRSYESTKLYRNLKLRGAIVSDKELMLLPKEQVFNKYSGVFNLSTEQGNLGTFIITNVRVVWFATLTESFNVSLPWIQIKEVKTRDSKFGNALVLETTEISGGYILGFRVNTNLDDIYNEINSLFKVYL
jgi:Bardet-Biedl syndrome 5 protein